jgi:putative transposase
VKIEVSVPEMVEVINEITQKPEGIFAMIRRDISQKVGIYLSRLMEVELTRFLGRARYERVQGEVNHRNGSYSRRFVLKGLGEVHLEMPRDRKGEFKTQVIPRSKRYENEMREALSFMFLTGVSTRSLSMLSKRLIGIKISPSEVSRVNREMIKAVEDWRTRDLSSLAIKYLFLDGVNFDMRIGRSIEKVPVLVAIGVTEKGQKRVLGFQSGDKESASTWREFFRDLKERGLDSSRVTLGIMDGLPGLEKVFKEAFSRAKVQRCQVHVARNVLAKVPRKLKKAVADELRTIFYASSKKRARGFFEQFRNKWQKDLPSAVKCLENSIDSCLTFFMCPEEEWISLRTTNIIERLNKEFKRRTKPMEIVAGENACYMLLAFISLKMECHWRSNPIGKVHYNTLPFFQKMAEKEFTQNT